MSDMLSISSTAVMAYQRALGTVSNNIANVGTEGYSRQDITLSANTPSKQGTVYIGNGVVFDGVKRQVNDFAESNLRNSQSELAAQEPVLGYANRVVDIMGSESTGLTSAINQFFAGAQELSVDPSSPILRASFLSDSGSLTSRFRELSGQLQSLQTETRQALESKVSEVNTLAQQLALINKQLAKNITVSKQPPELLDQRDLVLKNLSQFATIKTSFTTNGTVTVSLGPTTTNDLLVQDQQIKKLVATFGTTEAGTVTMGLRGLDGGIESLSNIDRGEMGGLLTFREQVLTPTRKALDTFALTFADAVNAVHSESLDGYGNPGTALFGFDAVEEGGYIAGGMRVMLDDSQKIAAAAQFRVIENSNNPSNLSAKLSYKAPSLAVVPPDVAATLKNNPNVTAGKAVTVSGVQPFSLLTSVAQGTQNVTIFFDDLQIGQGVQVMTREGVHVLGNALSFDDQSMILRDTYGFNTAASYSTTHLNQVGDNAYRQSDLFLGAKAQPSLSQVFDDGGAQMDGVALPALLQGGRISDNITGIAANVITLAGISMGELTAQGATLQASEVAEWFNSAGVAGLSASATNELRVSGSSLQLGMNLTLAGDGATTVTITAPAGGFGSAAALVAAINTQSATHQVLASLSNDGEVVLTNAEGFEGRHITVGPADLGSLSGNALGLKVGVAPKNFSGSIALSRTLADPINQEVRVGIGAAGTAADLQTLGLRTGVYIEGSAKDDYVFIVSGQGSFSASASYTASQLNVTQSLRAQPFDVAFTAANAYTITDRASGSVVSTRAFDANAFPVNIEYRGVTLTFTSPPSVGDKFGVDGNSDGFGNNEGMLSMLALSSAKGQSGKTFAEQYVGHISTVGNISQQALVSKDALTVVYDQAVEARDGISGVSLDVEAANLIRFQQAYQASAKVMQTASTLFDAILSLR
jgi:flagellar hook-associated protein FlgK